MHSLSAGRSRIPTWTLGDRLRKAREHAGYARQQDIADELHVSRSAVAGWENGTHAPSYLALYRWAEVTDVPLEWLRDGDPGGDGGDGGDAPITAVTLGFSAHRPRLYLADGPLAA